MPLHYMICHKLILRTKHFKRMKILSVSSRTCVECKHFPDPQMHPKQLFGCSSTAGTILQIDNDSNMDTFYAENIEDITKAGVIHVF